MGGVQLLSQADRPVERDPAHQFRIEEVPRLAADLPDAVVRLLPLARGSIGQCDQKLPRGRFQFAELLAKPEGGVEELTVHIQLRLVPGSVPDPDRPALAPP